MITKPILLLTAGMGLIGAVYGWHRTEIKRARQQEIAYQLAREVDAERVRFDSMRRIVDSADAVFLQLQVRFTRESRANAIQRDLLAGAATESTARADSVLALLMDSLPQLAGVRAAMDTLDRLAMEERRGRLLAEEFVKVLGDRLAGTSKLLAEAKLVIDHQAAVIEQLQKVGGPGAAGLTTLEVAVGAVLIIGAYALGSQ